jgi:carboxyl-terminal processing protease
MYMKKLIFLPIIFLSLFVSCKKNNIDPVVVTSAMARDSIYYIMNDWYYWYNLIPVVNKDDYPDPYKMLDAMRYKTLDRWSFVVDYDEFVAEMGGTFVGHGFRIGLDGSDNARIAMIYSNSPLYANGVRRGWIVKTINGTAVAPVLKANDGAAYSAMIGPSQAGITNIFVFKRPDNGVEVSITSTKSTFQINSVLLCDTIHLSNGAVAGQLVFESFISPSENELATAFAYFKANNISDLILDLRYNTGGYLSVAKSLASYIAGDAREGSVFAKLQYNNKLEALNFNYLFRTTNYSLGLTRLVVITTRSTASASEAVMNGLTPFVNVVSIGDTTYGKPTGMDGWDFGQKYIFYPITFKMVNADNQGDFFDGIIPEKTITDDITRNFIDREELCLKEAIHYLETGSVSTKGGVSPFKRHPQFSDKPAWMKNGFSLAK